MNRSKCAIVSAISAAYLTVSVPKAGAQVLVDVGAEPECPYGYYDYAPYTCAPYGY